MYTTTKGTQWELTPKAWKAIKKCAAKRFDGSGALFDACWNQYKQWLNGAIDSPENISDVMNWLDNIASEKVNNPRSRFYIYG